MSSRMIKKMYSSFMASSLMTRLIALLTSSGSENSKKKINKLSTLLYGG